MLKTADWLNRRADEVADETLGEAAVLTAEDSCRVPTMEETGVTGSVHRPTPHLPAVKVMDTFLSSAPTTAAATPSAS